MLPISPTFFNAAYHHQSHLVDVPQVASEVLMLHLQPSIRPSRLTLAHRNLCCRGKRGAPLGWGGVQGQQQLLGGGLRQGPQEVLEGQQEVLEGVQRCAAAGGTCSRGGAGAGPAPAGVADASEGRMREFFGFGLSLAWRGLWPF